MHTLNDMHMYSWLCVRVGGATDPPPKPVVDDTCINIHTHIHTHAPTLHRIRKVEVPPELEDVQALIDRMLIPDPHARLTIDEVKIT